MKTATVSQYEKQALDFCARYGVTVNIRRADPHGPGSPPAWDGPCGNQYKVSLTRTRDGEPSGLPLRFDFWGSQNDMEKGEDPTPYDILACISGDVNCPETFPDFCAEYGYDEDSRKALSTFKRCDKFGQKLRAFFPEGKERDALCEIA